MSIKAITWYWDNSAQDGHKLLLLLALADWSNDEGECYPRVGRLAQRARRKRRATQRAIKELETAGEILVHPGMGKGPEGKRSSLYYLLKYRASLGLEVPPMFVEAAKHYREKSRKQGIQGFEVRQLQARLLDDKPGVSSSTPVGVSPSTPVTGVVQYTPTGVVHDTQIRHTDPSVIEPSAATPPNDDDDDAFVLPLVQDDRAAFRSDRADQATPTDASAGSATDMTALSALRYEVEMQLDVYTGPMWDGRAGWLDQRSFDELYATLLWCEVVGERMDQDPDAIRDPVGFIRSGVEQHKAPGLRPSQVERIDGRVALILELAEKGILTP